MGFNPNIPQGSDPLPQSGKQIRANFQAINAAFADNHVALTQDNEFSGMHTVLTLRPQSGMSADPTTSATEIAIYNKEVSTIPELFFRANNSQTPIQLTYPSISMGVNLPDQYSFVAGPFVIFGGFKIKPANGLLVTLSAATTILYVDLIFSSVTGTFPNVPLMAAPTSIIGNQFNISFNPAISSLTNYIIYYTAICQ